MIAPQGRPRRPWGDAHVLALDSATSACSATLVGAGVVLAARRKIIDRGHTALLPSLVSECLEAADAAPDTLDLIAVTVGPGSFTGIRSAIALAQGLALAAGIDAVGVTVGEAIAESLPQLGGRSLWVATPSRRGRVFLDIDGQMQSIAVTELPPSPGRVAVAGAAALDIVSRLAARGDDVMLTNALYPLGRHIATVAVCRAMGLLPALAAEPLYIDAPEAKVAATNP